jgi:hypothetical protein
LEAPLFVQIIRGNVSNPDAVHAHLDRWMTDLGPSATGWLGSTAGVSEDGRFFALVRFESEDAARANSDRPEQGRWWAEASELFDGEPTFQDSTDITTELTGDPDAAGFVQVMTGQTSDPDRVRELMTQSDSDMRALRTDIVGSISVGHEDGKWTMVIYFTSEEAAREGERKEVPPEAQKMMEEMMALSVGAPEFLDIKSPWLESPK